jgi:hypothetical protein
VVHVVVGLIGAFVAHFAGGFPTLCGSALSGLVSSQTSLLAIWGALGLGQWWRRLAGVLVGVCYLGLLLELGTPEIHRIFVVENTASVLIPLLIVRFFKVSVELDCVPVASAGRSQFSIRDLLILTFVFGCLIAIGKSVNFLHFGLLICLFWIAGKFRLLGFLSVWLILATRRPVLYSGVLVAVGACAGYSWGQYSRIVGHCLASSVTETTVLVVSLLVVRSCGYRLVRLPPQRQRER